MKKILFTASIDSHILNFHIPYLKWFYERGFEVHVASNGTSEIPYVSKKYNVPIKRSPFNIENMYGYKQLCRIINENNYYLIHCHTPMGGVLTRFAARSARKRGTKVLYTAHGFHFYKGAPMKNWILYYPIEKLLSVFTDGLLTINHEDFEMAKTFINTKTFLVPGVGVDLEKFKPQKNEMKLLLREYYNFQKDDFILIYTAELSYRKRQDFLFDVIEQLKNKIPKIKLLLAGSGELYSKYLEVVRVKGIEKYVIFLGYRSDVSKLLEMSDLAVSSSRQEGLPVNVMEAMAVGLPIVVTNCRGNRDLVVNGVNGYTEKDPTGFANAILNIYHSRESDFGKKNQELIKKYSISTALERVGEIYKEYL
ncbi:glycosyltransferase family 4 protein [Cohnella lupini]|uniref:Glycosyltransferase EpsD n=1 Tax=Cohnella lupini TaxID=1294267 RepID=A0A3D9IXH7_9BACL|nr:glycosyltransferase family 4 protein [Cohnella lupini]RED65816.1 glycosyltransferase EpsD [Cohnella lupini]